MPREERVLTVFVASPDDVGDERTRLEEVIAEINTTWSRDLGVRLDLVRWETHADPGIATDAQDVVNRQIGDDYDIFIGILWCRYGTPTARSGSGTIEEFRRAKARFDENPSNVQIMVYFKDEAVPPSGLDPGQLAKVKEFRDSLGAEGALYWPFTDVDNFEKLMRLHLARQVQAWVAKSKNVSIAEAKEPVMPLVSLEEDGVEEDDLGILDLYDIFEERFEELSSMAVRIGKATEDVGERMTVRSREIDELPRDSQGSVNRKAARRLIAKSAADLDQFTARIEAELPFFHDALSKGMDALVRSVSISMEFDIDESEANKSVEWLENLAELRGVMAGAQQSLGEFRMSVATLPRMTSELNRAKRRALSAMDRLASEYAGGQTLLRESEAALQDMLGPEVSGT